MLNYKYLIALCLMCAAPLAIAHPEVGGLGELATGLSQSTTFLAKILWSACLIVGTVLLVTAFAQYQIHRKNPKLVPLGTPITYLFLAAAAFIIPVAEEILGFTVGISSTQQAIEERQERKAQQQRTKKSQPTKSKKQKKPRYQEPLDLDDDIDAIYYEPDDNQ